MAKAALLTMADLQSKVIARLRMEQVQIYGSLSKKDEEDLEDSLDEIHYYLKGLSQEAFHVLYDALMLGYSLECSCGRERVEIDGGECRIVPCAPESAS